MFGDDNRNDNKTRSESVKNRKGKWTEEENNMLTKIVQEYTERGETKTAAFKKAANLLGRSTAACSHRWNAVLSKKDNNTFPTAIQPLLLPPPVPFESTTTNELDLNQVINYLQQYKYNEPSENLLQENRQLIEEQKVLKEKNTILRHELEAKRKDYQRLIEQYEEFTKILNETETIISGHAVH